IAQVKRLNTHNAASFRLSNRAVGFGATSTGQADGIGTFAAIDDVVDSQVLRAKLDSIVAGTQVYVQVMVVVVGTNRGGNAHGSVFGIDHNHIITGTNCNDGLVEGGAVVYFANGLTATVDVQEVIAFGFTCSNDRRVGVDT